jgi:hypothetical protein
MTVKKTVVGRCLAAMTSLALVHATAPIVQAAPHLVKPSDMTARLVEQAQSRQEKVELFQSALALPEVKAKAEALGLNAEKISSKIPHLSDTELADLSARALRVKDVSAGHRHDGDNGGLVILGVALLLVAVIVLAAAGGDLDDWDDWDDCDCW